MLPSNKVQPSKIYTSKAGCIVTALSVGLLFFGMFKVSQIYGPEKSDEDLQSEYQFIYDRSISTANYDNNPRRLAFTTVPPDNPYTPPTVDRSTFASQLANTKVKYVIVDFGAHIDYADANIFCQENVGKDADGNIIGSGSALASVDINSRQSQNKQIWTMVRKCRDQVKSGTGIDCWIGLKWNTGNNQWEWENGQVLGGNSKTCWGDDTADVDRLGDGASPPAADFTSGSTNFCVNMNSAYNNYGWRNGPCDEDTAIQQTHAAICENPNYVE